ncbi:uncharacterized protein CEXT_522881 [Caerostris extrusa]|uniref:Uncharacterized protein n=1 Tax=Caerostris extrusa TaxID=172846 RepID=A0AAV4NTE0_CAEEX|nr:uncharacterized protein CEXT_522881 [Caerostris extrusa]
MQHITNPWQNGCIPGNFSPSDVTPNSVNPNAVDYGGLPSPASTAMYATTSTFSWAHTVPSFMPWVTKSDVNIQEPIVHFTAPIPPDPCTSQTATSWELLHNLGPSKCSMNPHLKRKSDLEVFDQTPQKLCITEERMAARFREMHISNQYSVPSESSPFGPCSPVECGSDSKSITNINELDLCELKDSEGELSKSVILAPELKKLVEPEKIFASAFLSKVERPSMALVPWQPNTNVFLRTAKSSEDKKTDDEDDSVPAHLSSQPCLNLNVKDNSPPTFDDEMDT